MKRVVFMMSIMAMAMHAMESERLVQRKTIVDIPYQAWKTNINELDFSSQQLTSIEGLLGQCKPSPSLSVPPLFPYKTLMKVVLKSNLLTTVDAREFSAFENLRSLDISHNKLTAIDIGAFFKACPGLKYLDASHNQICKVAWSDHPVWPQLIKQTDDQKFANSFPTIKLAGNNIATTDKHWLHNRYIDALGHFDKNRGSDCAGSTYGALVGGGMTGLMAIMTSCNQYAAIAVPVGCVMGGCLPLLCSGMIYGCCGNALRDNLLDSYLSHIPLHFDENYVQENQAIFYQEASCLNRMLCQ